MDTSLTCMEGSLNHRGPGHPWDFSLLTHVRPGDRVCTLKPHSMLDLLWKVDGWGQGNSWPRMLYIIDDVFQDRYRGISASLDKIHRDLEFGEETSQAAYLDSVFRKSRVLLYGDQYNKEGFPSEEETQENSERQAERTEFFENLGSVEELKYFMLKMKRVLNFVTSDTITDSTSTSVGFLNFSISEEFRLSVLNAIKSQNWEKVESLIMPIAAAFPGREALLEAFVVAAALLLSVVYQYLVGLVDRGGAKIYSSGSIEFRSIYISIVLFQGAYIWIKFRDVAPESEQHPSPGLHRKSKVNESGVTVYFGNYEPRFKPPRSKKSCPEKYISVGSYEEEEDAKTIYQILGFYYGKSVQGELPLLDGSTFPIPPMTEEEKRLDPETKKEWVKGKAKAVFEEYQVKFWGCLVDSEIQPTRDILNTVHPRPECPGAGARVIGEMDSSARVQADEAHPFQLGNQGDDLVPDISPGNCSPNVDPVTPGMQDHMANTLSGHVADDVSHLALLDSSMRALPETVTNIPVNGAGVPGEQPLELQLQQGFLQENQANISAIYVIPDDLSLQRQVKELQRQLQSQQLRNEQLESRISALEQQHQLQELVGQQLESRFVQFQQQQQLQQLGREQREQLRNEQLESRISALEGELECFRSTEHARKRTCSGFHSQN